MKIESEVLRLSYLVMETDDPVINGLWQTLKIAVLNKQTDNKERDEIFECVDRLEFCSPKSEPWIQANANYIRRYIQKLSPVS